MTTEPFARLVVKQPGGEVETYHVAASTTTVGRAPGNDIVLNDPKVSRLHARITVAWNACVVKDEGSTNGTQFEGRRVDSAVLNHGQSVLIGNTDVRFEMLAVAEADPGSTMVLNTISDLDSFLDRASLDVEVSDSTKPRVVVSTPAGTTEIALDAERLTIGRDPDNDIHVDDAAASRQHAVIENTGGRFLLRDLKSRNGTWLRGEPVAEHWLADGDTIRIGQTGLFFKQPADNPDATIIEAPIRTGRRPVLIVPGLLGSELWQGSERLWPNVKHLFRHPEDYVLSAKNMMEPRAIVDQVVVVPNLITIDQYGRLRSFLEEQLGYQQGVNLFEFPYDWRQDIRDSARQLAARVEELPVSGPIVLIAHSMGSLVSRYYVEFFGGRHRVERLIMMGAPHRGGPKALQTLLSGAGLRLPFGLLSEGIQQAFSSFPSAYGLLPSYPSVFDHRGEQVDIFDNAGWLAEDRHDLLRSARDLHGQLGVQCSVPSVSIFGYGINTTVRLNVERTTSGRWRGFSFVDRRAGDGTVPETSAVLPGSEIHPVRQHHGALYADTDVKKRLMLELSR